MKRYLPATLLLAAVAVLLALPWQPGLAAVVTGANVQRYYRDGSSGYDYEHMIAGSNAGAIDPLGTDGSGSLKVNLTGSLPAGSAALGSVTAAGDVASAASDSGNPVKIGGKAASSAPSAVTNGQRVNAYFDLNGRLVVLLDSALPTGTNSIGSVTVGTALPAGTNTIGAVNLQPATTGGLSVYRNLDLGTTGVVVKASAGQLYGYVISNQHASATRYVKVYDKATAGTSGDTPVMTIPVPYGALANVAFPNGIAFASGISLRASTAIADADTGAPSTNDVVISALNYK